MTSSRKLEYWSLLYLPDIVRGESLCIALLIREAGTEFGHFCFLSSWGLVTELDPMAVVVRLKYIKSDLPLRTSTTCIAVFPNGRFHLEERSDWPEYKTQIYGDFLPDNDLVSLRTTIDDPELKDLKGIDKGNAIFRQGEHGEVVWARISRGDVTQSLLFNAQTGTADRSSKVLPKALAALVGWSDAAAKILHRGKVRPLKNSTPVNCWLTEAHRRLCGRAGA